VWVCSLWCCRGIARGCAGCGDLDVVAVVDDAVVVAVVVDRVLARRLRGDSRLLTSSRSYQYSMTFQRQQQDHPIERQHWEEQLAHCDWQGQSAIVAEKVVAIAIAVDWANEHCQVVQSAMVSCTFDVWKVCIERTCRDA
jgi:hypothetical protein